MWPKGKKRPEFSGSNHPMYGMSGEKSPTWRLKRPDVSERNKKNPLKGERHPMFGKKFPSISKWRTEQNKVNNPAYYPEVRKKKSERMKNGGAAYCNQFIKNPSKPQVQLFEQIKLSYPSAILNYPYKRYSIDIAIPELKLAIEYDGKYWHKGREEADGIRQREIEKDGWKFVRLTDLSE